MISDILSEKTKADFLQKESEKAKIQQYATSHYDELMNRPCAFMLFGPACPKSGAALPSPRLVNPKDRILSTKRKGKNMNVYYFDENRAILRVDKLVDGRIDDTTVFFEYEGIRYGVPFEGNSNTLYALDQTELYGISEKNGNIDSFWIVSSGRIYVEFYRSISDGEEEKTECTWFRYVLNESHLSDFPILPGRVFSPLQCGVEIYNSVNNDICTSAG